MKTLYPAVSRRRLSSADQCYQCDGTPVNDVQICETMHLNLSPLQDKLRPYLESLGKEALYAILNGEPLKMLVFKQFYQYF